MCCYLEVKGTTKERGRGRGREGGEREKECIRGERRQREGGRERSVLEGRESERKGEGDAKG